MESNIIADIDIGTIKALQQIHAYIVGNQIRTKTISKDGFTFCLAEYLPHELQKIESMPEDKLDQIVSKGNLLPHSESSFTEMTLSDFSKVTFVKNIMDM